MVEFKYTELLPLGEDSTEYRKISDTGFKIEKLGDKIEARKIAASVGAPLVQGTQDPLNNAEEAFELLAMHDIQVILSDQRMPQMNGTEFLKVVKQLYPDTIRIVLSGYTDLKSVTDAINSGAIYKFITKPWNDAELRKEIQHAFLQVERKAQASRGGEL